MYDTQSQVCSQHLLDLRHERERAFFGAVVVHDLAISIDEELGEVPWDLLGYLLAWGAKSRSKAQKPIEWMGKFSIHVNFGEEREFRTIFTHCELFDFCFCSRLLTTELITWEGEDFETLFAELLMDLNHFFVVLIGQTSPRCDVHDHDTLLPVDQCL